MKFVPEKVSRFVAGQAMKANHASPNILFAAGVVGVVATTVLAAKATLRLEEVLLDANADLDNINSIQHSDYSKQDLVHDKTVIYTRSVLEIAKLYAPAIVVGTLSIGALTQSHRILTKRNAGLAAAYKALDKAYEEYRGRVRELVGEEREQELYRAPRYLKDDEETAADAKLPLSGNPYARWWDPTTSKACSPTPEYRVPFLRLQQNYMNDMLRTRGHVLLNDVYDALGLSRTTAGAVVGWRWGGTGDNFIDFGIFSRGGHDTTDWVMKQNEVGGIFLDFNVDGVIFKDLGELHNGR